MVQNNWKVPWQQIQKIQEIQELLASTQAQIQRVFREANKLANKLANEALECRGIMNMDKAEIPSILIKTRKITVQATHQERDQEN
ncbi:hypothetical protein H5410_027187 [Solanum commersonii]|uniref:Uncharacterized protein n=1 Tax=Solanum commersonii TaxID=4109 RepID=A0A9J5Z194_SOLCO|nr:hypothetical protein H5410_027187 [Solanum commersonii]